MGAGRRAGLALMCAGLALPAALAAQEQAPAAPPKPGAAAKPDPPCVESCRKLAESGDLSKSYSKLGCLARVCQEEARAFYQENQFDEAMASLDHIAPQVKFSPSFQLDRGLVNYALGNFDAAIANFDAVLEVRPQSIRAAAQRAHALLRLGRIPEARAQFEKMFELDKIDLEYNELITRSYVEGNLGVLRLAEFDIPGGTAQLQKAFDRDSRNELARTYLKRVVPALESGAVQPDAIPHLIAASEEVALGRANAALRELSWVLSRYPDFKFPYMVASLMQRRFNDYKGCETTLRVAQQRFPDDTEVFANRIRCTMLRYGVHAPESAPSIQELKELAEQDPNDPLVQEMLMLLSQ
ncbi:MAG: tetratricopeptide repeat protein [Gemmatimonadota bacterium]